MPDIDPETNEAVIPPSAKGLPPYIPPPAFDAKLLDPHGVANKPMKWPGHDGTPFKGPTPDLKKDDRRQPEIGYQVFTERLDLSDEKQMLRYNQITQIIGNQFGKLSFEDRQWVEKKENWVVLIRWMLEYAYMPK